MKERKKRKRRARALECFERPRALSLFLSLGGVRVAGSPRRGRRPFRGKVKEEEERDRRGQTCFD